MTAIRVHSGRLINLADPQPEDIDIEDIAHSLSLICRFTGHVNWFDSVAEHSFVVSRLVPEEDALAGLMHDATEAYLTDVSGPLKGMLPDYKVLERRMWEVIADKFYLPKELPASVHEADNISLIWEQRDLMNNAGCSFPELAHRIPTWNWVAMKPYEAERSFLYQFDRLGGYR